MITQIAMMLCLGVAGWNPDGSVQKTAVDGKICFVYPEGRKVKLVKKVFRMGGKDIWKVRCGRFNKTVLYLMLPKTKTRSS